MKITIGVITNSILILVGTVTMPLLCLAENSSQAKVLEINGSATYLRAGTTEWATLEPTTILAEGDRVKTDAQSQVRLECAGNVKTAELLVRKNTEFVFTTFRHDEAENIDNTLLNVGIGGVLVKAEKLIGASKFEVKTPNSLVGVRGTMFEVYVGDEKGHPEKLAGAGPQ